MYTAKLVSLFANWFVIVTMVLYDRYCSVRRVGCLWLASRCTLVYTMCSTLRCYLLGGMFPGTALGDLLTLDDVVAAIARLQKELSGVVKATIESTLGQLGTVGAMAVDEFVGQLTAAVSRLVPASGLKATVPGEDAPLISSSSSVGVAPVEGDAQKDLSVVSRTASMVPSIFGEGNRSRILQCRESGCC